MSLLNLSIGKSYTFNTKAPAILGTIIKNAKMISQLDYESAVAFDNIDLKFRTIYPALPPGTPDNPQSCTYYRFLSESGEKIIMADQWIDETTVEVVEHINFQVTFADGSLADMTRVRDALNALSFTNYVIKQI